MDPRRPGKSGCGPVRWHHRPWVHDPVAAAAAAAPDVYGRRHQAGDQLRPQQGSLSRAGTGGVQSALVSVDDLGNGAVQAIVSTTVEIDGSPKPACVAESIVRYIS